MSPAPGVPPDAPTSAARRAAPAPAAPPLVPGVRRPAATALRCVALLAWGLFAATSGLLARPAVADAAPPPDAAERAAYWLDRLMRGPDGPTLGIPHYHQNLIVDAQQGLVDVREATLDRLADEGLRERVTASRDTNAWHGILGVLVLVGPDRPQVARAWAAPALQHPEVTLRRLAANVFAALRAPEDVAVLLEALRRDATDRMIAPTLVETLVATGPGAAAEAARLAYERLAVDGSEGASVWNHLPGLLDEVRGGPFDDVLAWWGLLTDGSGPRAPDPGAVRGHALPRIDPDRLAVLALAHFVTDGRRSTAEAHARLALRGRPTAKAAVQAALASPDPVLRASAARTEARLRRGAGADRAEVRAGAATLLDDLRALEARGPAAATELAEALRADPDPQARALLLRLLAALPHAPAWKEPIEAAHAGVLAGGGDPTPFVDGLLRTGRPADAEIALHLIRRSRDPRYVEVLERWHDDPASAPTRPRLRREIVFLVVASLEGRARMAPDRLAAFAAKVRAFAEDPRDASAGGFVATLLDLGAPGQAELAAGLAGPRRGVFVEALRGAPQGRLDAAGLSALLAPVTADTPVAERAAVLHAAYFTARGSGVPVLEALRLRLPADARGDVDALIRMIRHRAP